MSPASRRAARLLGAALALALVAGCREAPSMLVDGPELLGLEPGARFWSRTCELAIGSTEAEPSLVAGWSKAEPDGDWRWSTGLRSELWLDALGQESLRLGFEAWAYVGATEEGAQRVEVSVGDREIGSVELGLEPAEHFVEVPEGVLVAGRNRLVFAYAHAAPAPAGDPRILSVAWRRVWTEAPGLPGTRCGDSVGGFEGGSLRLPLESGVELFFDAPEERWLRIGSLGAESTRAAPAASAATEDGSGPTLRVVVERGGSRVEAEVAVGARDVRLELPASDGPTRLALIARAGAAEGTTGAMALVVGGARLARSDSAKSGEPAPAKRAATASAAPARPPNVLVYLVDTLRADHLGCYGYERPTSPRLDAFAREGVLFERAVAQSSWTRPTAATVLTGLDPRVHGVHRRGDRLHDEVVTLPERLRERGYETAAVVTNGNVSAAFGFQQGFDTFTYLPERKGRGRHRRSRRVTEIAAAWLAERIERDESRPFFLYLHTTDPHAPYSPAPAFGERLLDREPEPRLGSLAHLRALEEGRADLGPDELADLVALYDAEIAFNDHWFGVLLDRLEELELASDTLVVFLADHGEEFGEHGGWQHGRTLYQEQLHIPLVIRLPGGELAGSRRAERVQQSDIVPTVLEVIGAPPVEGLQGRALVRRGRDGLVEELASSAAFAILDLDGYRAEASYDGFYKLVRRHGAPVERPRLVELFDLEGDPGETVDRSWDDPARFGYLDALLRSRRALWPAGAAAEAVIDEELAEELRALGYVH